MISQQEPRNFLKKLLTTRCFATRCGFLLISLHVKPTQKQIGQILQISWHNRKFSTKSNFCPYPKANFFIIPGYKSDASRKSSFLIFGGSKKPWHCCRVIKKKSQDKLTNFHFFRNVNEDLTKGADFIHSFLYQT